MHGMIAVYKVTGRLLAVVGPAPGGDWKHSHFGTRVAARHAEKALGTPCIARKICDGSWRVETRP